jgi:hypothetical protein
MFLEKAHLFLLIFGQHTGRCSYIEGRTNAFLLSRPPPFPPPQQLKRPEKFLRTFIHLLENVGLTPEHDYWQTRRHSNSKSVLVTLGLKSELQPFYGI